MFIYIKIFIITIIISSTCLANNKPTKIYSAKELDNLIIRKRADDMQKINIIIRNMKPWRLFK